MKTKNPLNLDLSKYIEKLQKLLITESKKLEDLLSEISNYTYDTYEYVLELGDAIDEIPNEKAESIVNDLLELINQVTPCLDLLEKIDIESRNMDRAKDRLSTIEREIPNLIELLKAKN